MRSLSPHLASGSHARVLEALGVRVAVLVVALAQVRVTVVSREVLVDVVAVSVRASVGVRLRVGPTPLSSVQLLDVTASEALTNALGESATYSAFTYLFTL